MAVGGKQTTALGELPAQLPTANAATSSANAVYETISDADLIGEIRRRYSSQPSLVVLALCERYEAVRAENDRLRTRGGIARSLMTARQAERFHDRCEELNT